MAKINIKINGRDYSVESGTTILDACRQVGIKIPTLCYLEKINCIGACRVCMVEVKGARTLVAACTYPIDREGTEIFTNTPKVIKSRKTTVELLLSDHDQKCLSCPRNTNCELQTLAYELGCDANRFQGAKNVSEKDESSVCFVRDNNKCVLCRRCVAVCEKVENEKVIEPELHPQKALMNMGEVARKVSEATGNDSILVTDVGQNQMLSARYYRFKHPRSLVTSGGLGTMGFGLPAAIGAKIGNPDRTVCFFTGDGGIQMTVQELGTIMQYGIDVKIIILNNNFLGMVRQWQALFFDHRYSETPMLNPDFTMIAAAYGIDGERVATREELDDAIERMLSHRGSYLLDVQIDPDGMVFPMTPAGACVTNIMLNATEKY